MRVLLRRKDEIEVPVLPAAEGALNRRCVFHQESVEILDGSVFGLA